MAPTEVAAAPPDDELDDDFVEVPRRGRTALAIALVVALVLSGLVGVLATRDPAGRDERRIDYSVLGDSAFDVTGRTIGGDDFDMGVHRGRWVIVNFFATWCVPCRQEHPELVDFDETHRAQEDAVLISVLYDDDPDTASEYFEANGGDWPVVLDRNGEIAVEYGVTGVPETYVVAPSGRLLVRITGGVTRDLIERVIADAERQAEQQQQGTDQPAEQPGSEQPGAPQPQGSQPAVEPQANEPATEPDQ
jgi:cytochrome c biogenesis protein CcmG, thiol:disulfide interchange protein DsbE